MLSRTLSDDGCTLLNPLKHPYAPTKGYIIGMFGFCVDEEVIEDTNTWINFVNLILQKYILNNCQRNPFAGIGTWMHKSESLGTHVHFDVVAWYPGLEQAKLLGYIFNQHAIYDVANCKEIVLDEDGKNPCNFS